MRKLKLGLVAAAAVAAAVPLLAQPAYADPAPSSTDAVGVGSDTVQYASDFIADGDFLGDAGFNSGGGVNRVINFDATPDADARLAYGAPGVGTGTCAPGLGGTAGTGNATGTHSDKPCILNPTIVLRQGLTPVQRVNGSGAGGHAGANDTNHYIDYVRASSSQKANLSANGVTWDSITIGTDALNMLAASTTHAPTALSKQQLAAIYQCTDTTWNQVGGTGTNTIIPIIPQTGSGTRSSFETAIGITDAQVGACVQVGEENDPFAITNVPAGLTPAGSSADAIEPMSSGRLNMFLGTLGAANGNPEGPNGVGGYFQDPSCQVEVTTPAACVGSARTLTPSVKFLATTGNASDSNPAFTSSRSLFIYFRDSDVGNTSPFGQNNPFEPHTLRNLVRTLFYNPCSTGLTGCVTINGTQYGPGGQPYYATPAGQALIAAAGIDATWVFTPGGA